MSNVNRLKREMLRGVVRENVDLIRGGPIRQIRRQRRLWIGVRVLTLTLLSLALFGSSQLLWTLSREPGAPGPAPAALPTAAFAALPGSALPRPGSPAPEVEERTVAIPVTDPIDADVFPLAVRKVAIDAGHGGSSVGTRAPRGLLEKDLTLDIARRLEDLLEEDGSFEVLMTRLDDADVSLDRRAALANEAGADIFLSIHLNWIEIRESRGVETYYLGPTNDPYLSRLAASENRDSGYSLADMRSLLDRIYAGVRQEKSRRLAETVQSSLFHSLGRVNPEIEDRGVKAAPFIVLLSTEMPAILAEVSCLSNDDEARLLTKPLYRQYIAEALSDGIRAYADAVTGASDAKAGKKGT
jgi:N-acetylmuramoyl-L-alanine amidase